MAGALRGLGISPRLWVVGRLVGGWACRRGAQQGV